MTLYNPHLLARQELIDTFVARTPLLEELVDGVRRGGSQHHLLIGNRGSGKTTLLLRLATAIEDDPKLTKKAIPLRFPEEQYNVSQVSDFWMNAIDALVDALERQGDHAAAKRVEALLETLEPLDEVERAARALAVLERWAKQSKRLIVLLIDNLDLILDRLVDSLWAVREALSADNRLVVIGASSRFIDEAIDYQSPFYDFFHVHELGPLSEAEARRVVLSLAERDHAPRVAEVLEHDPGRFKALYVLTGGTPRTLALLHGVLASTHHDRIERDLEGLLDQLTPYYKARFDDLPAQSQVIVDKVALHWHPITAAECQVATGLDVNTVSAQLHRLVKNGVLAKVAVPGVGRLGFQISERFFNIWYLMRASRRLRRRLAWFVEFLRIFYGEDDLRQRAEALLRTATAEQRDQPAQLLAFAAAVPDERLRRRLEFRAIGALMEDSFSAIREVMDLEGEDVHLVPVIDRVRALREIRRQITHAKVAWPDGLNAASVATSIVGDPLRPLSVKRELATRIERGAIPSTVLLPAAWSPLEQVFGTPLLDAIASGELPTLSDATTMKEMTEIIAMGQTPELVMMALIGATERVGTPLSDEMLESLLERIPGATLGFLGAAVAMVVGDRWPRARSLALKAVKRAPPELDHWIMFLSFCVNQQLAAEAVELLVAADLAERWAPLFEALSAVAEHNRARLDGLAPEMRVAAVALFDQLGGGKHVAADELRYQIDPADTRPSVSAERSRGTRAKSPRRATHKRTKAPDARSAAPGPRSKR
ncbi:MAG: AAA family ATPase [Kofleriaceae bacterium]